MDIYRCIPYILTAVFLAGCQTTGTSSTGSLSTGPAFSTSESVRTPYQEQEMAPTIEPLDVVVAVFDPGLPDDPAEYKGDEWPELRRAESRYVAVRVRDAIADTRRFGAVRVTPDTQFSSDVFVEGEILCSNGEEMKLLVTVTDSTGKKWFSKRYAHRVDEAWYRSIRNENSYPFQPVYDDIAEEIVKRLERKKESDLEKIHTVTDMRFAQNLSPDAFSEALEVRRGRVRLNRLPAQNDPMLERVTAIKYRDQMFVDTLQEQYDQFAGDMSESYRYWQSQSCAEVNRRREARNSSILKGIGGLLLIAGAVAVSDNNCNNDILAATAAVGGGMLIADAWKDNEEAGIHADVIDELASSIDGELAPKVIEMEDRTVTLTGNMQEQTQQWRGILAQIWEAEALPEGSDVAM